MLDELIAEARKEKKWLWCHYQDLWFSPDELEAENAAGRFRWGPINWKLRDPLERLAEADVRLANAQADRDRAAAAVSAND